MDEGNLVGGQLVYRCEGCGYQTWTPSDLGPCPVCGTAQLIGLTPVEWRRRLAEQSLAVAEVPGGELTA